MLSLYSASQTHFPRVLLLLFLKLRWWCSFLELTSLQASWRFQESGHQDSMPVPEDVKGREVFVSLPGFPSKLWCAAGGCVLETHFVA